MRRTLLLLAVAACTKHAVSFHGTTYEAEIPSGWHTGTHPLADAARALANGTPAHADVQTLVDDHDHAIIVAEITVGEPHQELAAPQANLMASVASGVVHAPPLTDDTCARLFERFHLPNTVHKLDGIEGCTGTSVDGARRIALVQVDTQMLIVTCSAGVDRACDDVLRSIRPRPAK